MMGNKSCEICGYVLLTDIHHWSKTETSYLCPNCHAIYERIIRIKKGKLNQYKKRYAIPQIKKYLDGFTNQKSIEMFKKKIDGIVGYILRERTYWRADSSFNSAKDICLSSFEQLIIDMRGCEICLFNVTTDKHHFGNKDCDKNCFFNKPSVYRSNRKSILLCPNHHAILHRILKDIDGTKYNSKIKIINDIKRVIKNGQ